MLSNLYSRQQEGDGEFTTLQPLQDPTQTAENSETEGSSDSVSNQEATTPATDVDTTNTGSYHY